MAAVAQKGAKSEKRRAGLALELLELRKNHGEIFGRIEAINTELKAIASDEGESFRETIVGVGYVSVSPPSPAKFKGDFPIVQIEAWKALKPARQQKLIDDGVVKIEGSWSKPYYGQVTVKLF